MYQRTKREYFLSAIVKFSKKREKISFSDFGSPTPLSSLLRPSICCELPLGALLFKRKSARSRGCKNTNPFFTVAKQYMFRITVGLLKEEKNAWKLSVNNTKIK